MAVQGRVIYTREHCIYAFSNFPIYAQLETPCKTDMKSAVLILLLASFRLIEASKLMVVGGTPTSAFPRCEVVDLTTGRNCANDCGFAPGSDFGGFGFYSANRGGVVVCGGEHFGDPVSQCASYDNATNAWSQEPGLSLSSNRSNSAGASVNSNRGDVWITGGRNEVSFVRLPTTDILKSGADSFESHVDLPLGLAYHSLLALNDTHSVVLGGERTSDVFIFDGRDGAQGWGRWGYPQLSLPRGLRPDKCQYKIITQ